MTIHLAKICLCLLTLIGCGALEADEPAATARQKSVTVYPVVITTSHRMPPELQVRIAEVLGLMLERGGMEEIEIGQSTFAPPETKDVSQLAQEFGQFVVDSPPKTEYAIFAQYVGEPGNVDEIRTIVVDDQGKVVFADLANQKVFAHSEIKPKNPMSCTMFVASRLQQVWELGDADRADAPEGKMAQIMRKRSGLPADDELTAMNERLDALKPNFSTTQVTVYPIHLWPGSDKASASQLAQMLTEQGICRAQFSETDPQLTVEGDPNQQKVLWDTARAFREFLRNNPPETPYALLADYGLHSSPDGKQWAHHVHLILCDRTGDWVLADYQNSHHADFQSVSPVSADDCNRLAALRLKRRLSR